MARLARGEVFDPGEVAIGHVYARVVRRCWLFGDDPVSGKNFDHRKVWIEGYLRQFAAAFGIDLLCFSILSNHFHLILRPRPDLVATWNDREVARRWMLICPHRKYADGSPMEPTESEINTIAGCPVKCAAIRQRLSSISWWMRLLCQRVAMRANREDEQQGHFFQDRYGATKLVDEASLLACAAYVDLNPIRAAICETLQASQHSSVQRRIDSLRQAPEQSPDADAALTEPGKSSTAPRSRPDDCLAPLSIDERHDPVGPHASSSGLRASDKGFLAMSIEDYLQLLEWTARQATELRRGQPPASVAPILQRLGLDPPSWCELVSDFGKLFCHVAGRPERVDCLRSPQTHRRFHLRRRARELFAAV